MVRDLIWIGLGLAGILVAIVIGTEAQAWLGSPKLALLIGTIVMLVAIVCCYEGAARLVERIRRRLRARDRVPRARVVR